ncbi:MULTISPECIES: glycosyltransferase family A protein [unclassified Lacticaseibacillus]|uniref:glycosyltransferase family 2 protein n=1 Tax=unclassified Lacticaseibacillus TaxID=2759744 RepID=UPI00194260D2|nr:MULTISPECIES: glycosyltransferase family A protein [unclassified Lacticaseibacillus]
MKLLSIVVPSYNSSRYLERCVDSLLVGGEQVQIIIVDDGSTDETGQIADDYVSRYPTIVRAVHQPNGGHGAAINAGLDVANGKYFKVVDSDDWLAPEAFRQWLSRLSQVPVVDMAITNYTYVGRDGGRTKAVGFRHWLPQGTTFGWNQVRLPVGKYLTMHTVTYRTDLLRRCHLSLPHHLFYEDSLYVFQPLPSVHSLRYWNLDLYQYVTGRQDQSVNETVMLARIDQQLTVNRALIKIYRDLPPVTCALRNYMAHYIEVITGISSFLLLHDGSASSMHRKQDLWQTLRSQEPQLYTRVRRSIIGRGVNLPGRWGRLTAVGCYRVLQRVYRFN